ncbi:integrase family protein [Acinetobacter sp.]|uniref:tyrosine-type recombinase/integrase n=1 Tax=Acinetobacter sp. TaxID=472 RepID=UPI0031E21510
MASNKTRLTVNRVKDFKCPLDKKEAFLWDEEITGLAVKANPGGSKKYVYHGRIGGKPLKITLGDCSTWTPDSAKQEAKRLSLLCAQGIDPRNEKQDKIDFAEQQRQQAIREQLTFGKVWDAYIEANKGRWGKRYVDDHIRLAQRGGKQAPARSTKKITIAQPIASLLDIRLSELSASMLEEWVKKENQTRATSTATSYRMVRACLNWCEEQNEFSGLLPDKSYNAKKVKQQVKKVGAKRDCLQREQLRPFFTEILKINNPIVSAYLQFTLLTGARRNEVERLKWVDIDFKWNHVLLHDKVDSDGRTIPLTPYLSQIISALPKLNDYVFASLDAEAGVITNHLTHLQCAVQRAGIPHLTIHGLRRSFETLAEWVEMPKGISYQISGHKPSGTVERHYIIRPLDLLRIWHTKYEAWILNEAGFIQTPENQYRHTGKLSMKA